MGAGQFAIQLPDATRAGAIVLFNETMEWAESHMNGLSMLQQIRGRVEHFVTAITIWGRPCAPVDSLMVYQDAIGQWRSRPNQ